MSKRPLSVWLAVVGCLATSPIACKLGSAPCQLRSRYQYVTDDFGKGELTFSPNGADHYIAHETGVASFMGMTTFSEGVLRIVFETADGRSGTYTWELDPSCSSGKGRLDLAGGGVHQSTLSAVE